VPVSVEMELRVPLTVESFFSLAREGNAVKGAKECAVCYIRLSCERKRPDLCMSQFCTDVLVLTRGTERLGLHHNSYLYFPLM
jgi:hypothetical protein